MGNGETEPYLRRESRRRCLSNDRSPLCAMGGRENAVLFFGEKESFQERPDYFAYFLIESPIFRHITNKIIFPARTVEFH